MSFHTVTLSHIDSGYLLLFRAASTGTKLSVLVLPYFAKTALNASVEHSDLNAQFHLKRYRVLNLT